MRSRQRFIRTAGILSVPNGILVVAAYFLAAPESIDWLTLSALLALAIILAIGWTTVFDRRWIEPIERINRSLLNYSFSISPPNFQPIGASPIRRLAHRLNRTLRDGASLIADYRARGSTFQTIADALPDPMILTDVQQRIAVMNEPAARLLRISPSQAQGQKLVNVINDESILNLLDALSLSHTSQSADVRLRRDGQRLVFRAIAAQAKTGEVLLALQDVTTLTTAMQMKTDFVANASHELRTPLAAIKTAFETLREIGGDDPRQSERCAVIIEGHLARLEDMLRDLLDLSRLENPELVVEIEAVRISEIVQAEQQLFAAAAASKGVTLQFDLETAAADQPFHTDRRLLQLIAKNLIENGLKFTPSGGSVTVRFRRDGRQVEFAVADTGIGIAPQHQQRIFERFYQVDSARSGSAGRGTGLGLAIVKHAVNSLGGSLELRSDVGRGTTVTCRFAELG